MESIETPWDKWQKKKFLNGRVLQSLSKLIDRASLRLQELEERREPGDDSKNQIDALEAKRERWRKDYNRIQQCQSEWIGFEPTCCHSRGVAVPVGCNHRLCNLCNSHRSEKYRERVRFMFDRLEHPVFLTLTVPNVRAISKRTYSTIRNRIRKLFKQHKGWMKGGLYSLETTYNRKPEAARYGRWHVHAHILLDSTVQLPRSRPMFVRFKRRIEFDWLLLTGGRKHGWRNSDFDYWFHETNRRSNGAAHNLRGPENRRIVDIRPVRDRQKAAFEVLKYITKPSDFADVPEAVGEFLTAVRGTRMIQTFGSWYGFSFPENANDWSHLTCGCGKNQFKFMGRLFREDVEMGPGGRWQLKRNAVGFGPIRGRPPEKKET